jgi:hypothetical protein
MKRERVQLIFLECLSGFICKWIKRRKVEEYPVPEHHPTSNIHPPLSDLSSQSYNTHHGAIYTSQTKLARFTPNNISILHG